MTPDWERLDAMCTESEHPFDAKVAKAIHKLGQNATVTLLSEDLDCSQRTVRNVLERLHAGGYAFKLALDAETVVTGVDSSPNAPIQHVMTDFYRDWARFGFTGDNHLCNRHERLDVLNAAYDMFEAEGITTVYNTGNWIDGEARFNRHELTVFGMDNQIAYWVRNYPSRKGITTHYVAGDDHEGWYQQRECIEIGRYAMLQAEASGRKDLKYLGYIEADIALQVDDRTVQMKVVHPGGGTSYAVSYKGQKLVESYQGGEKPNLILQGHYHKFNVGYPREVWVVDTGTTCDQTGFMRKKHLQAMVGFGIVSIHRHPMGGINRIQTEFVPFYDRGFYASNRRKFGGGA